MRRQRGSRWGMGALRPRLGVAASLAALALVGPTAIHAAPGLRAPAAAEPVYWRQRVFFIPYQPSAQSPLAGDAEKVQLMVARDGGRNWQLLEAAQPNVRGFSYHAPADGEYSFAVALTNRRGDVWPKGDPTPMLRVVVDTQLPTLRLTATPDAGGQVLVGYEASDLKLRAETLRIEARTGGGNWQPLAAGPPDLNQPDRLQGRASWKAVNASGRVEFRATIQDRAGNLATATIEASAVAPAAPTSIGPQLGPAFDAVASPVTPPSNGGEPFSPFAAGDRSAPPPPLANPYTAANAPTPSLGPASGSTDRTPARFAADTGPTPPASRPLAGAEHSIAAPSLLAGSAPPSGNRSPFNTMKSTDEGWSSSSPVAANSPAPLQDTGMRWVNSLTFDIDYDLQSVGPWGVAKVELWATRDGGQTWTSFGVDPDNRSPIRATAPAAGAYGFRIVVHGANSPPMPPPQAGDKPELQLGVDLDAPRAELRAAEVGSGNLSDRLTIRWTATDEHLDARPVGLFYSNKADGPWSTIATNLENSGEYSWQLERRMPERIFLRIEARDIAGNVGTHVSTSSIVLNLPQPTGRLRSVRPVLVEPSRFRTADRQP